MFPSALMEPAGGFTRGKPFWRHVGGDNRRAAGLSGGFPQLLISTEAREKELDSVRQGESATRQSITAEPVSTYRSSISLMGVGVGVGVVNEMWPFGSDGGMLGTGC